jgi:hypothetical protein
MPEGESNFCALPVFAQPIKQLRPIKGAQKRQRQ